MAEVGAALDAGIEVIVTDHHQPGEKLPECPILHPALSGYPFGELCATGVAYKLAAALRGERAAEAELDLVALATVADLVPLRGENRALVRRGLAVARRARRPGLRALLAIGVGRARAPRRGRLRLPARSADQRRRSALPRRRRGRADAHRRRRAGGGRSRPSSSAPTASAGQVELEVLAAAERARAELPPELADARRPGARR